MKTISIYDCLRYHQGALQVLHKGKWVYVKQVGCKEKQELGSRQKKRLENYLSKKDLTTTLRCDTMKETK
jgi:hypothetical protein